MPKKFSPQQQEHYGHIQAQAGKIVFLGDMLNKCRNDSLIAPETEMNFIEHGFAEMLNRIKANCNEYSIERIAEQIEIERNVLENLNKQSIKD